MNGFFNSASAPRHMGQKRFLRRPLAPTGDATTRRDTHRSDECPFFLPTDFTNCADLRRPAELAVLDFDLRNPWIISSGSRNRVRPAVECSPESSASRAV